MFLSISLSVHMFLYFLFVFLFICLIYLIFLFLWSFLCYVFCNAWKTFFEGNMYESDVTKCERLRDAAETEVSWIRVPR